MRYKPIRELSKNNKTNNKKYNKILQFHLVHMISNNLFKVNQLS